MTTGARRGGVHLFLVNVVAPVRGYIDALVHASARANPLDAARHRNFIAVRLLGGLLAFAILPIYLVQRGTLTLLEIVLFGWFVAPIAIAYFVSRTGRYDTAQILSSLAVTILVGIIGVSLDGVSSAVAIWLILVPLEAALGGSRPVVLMATGFSLVVATLTLGPGESFAVHHSGVNASVVNAAGVIAGIAYAVMLALNTEFFTRTSSNLLLEEGERYRLLASNMTDVVSRHGAGGAAMFVSTAAQRVFGAPERDLLGQGILHRVHVTDRPAYLSALADAANGRGDASAEFRVRRDVSPAEARAGRQFVWVEMRCRRMNDQGANNEVVAVMRDVTERKHQETIVASARREAEEANEAKGRFLAMMSHELRTPLNAVIGFSEMLMQDQALGLDAARRGEYSRLIHESGHHLLSVVNLVLDMSKIENGSFVVSLEPSAIAPLVRNCCDLLALKAHESGLQLSVHVDEGMPEIAADKRAFKQILLNLISNAIKFTLPGGQVSVRAKMLGADELMIAVEDTGVGIAESDMPHIGSPFYQASGSYDRRYDGTGLGLSIVKGLVRLHGGRMEIDSRVGVGTTVRLFVPRDGRMDDTVVDLTLRDPAAVSVPTEPEYDQELVVKRA
jgi:cell cycle sensor histidine kinase DivJ